VRDYLLEEVFQQQPAPMQQFLLRTAILDQLCAPLCDALVHDEDDRKKDASDAVAPEAASFIPQPSSLILAQLERANLFLIPLDDKQRWYRYHHLFGEFLRQRLAQEPGMAGETVAELHMQASRWYAAEKLDLEALRHAAAAADPTHLAYLAEQSWQRMDSSFQTAAWRHWVRQVPEEIVRTRPELCIQYANALMNAGELEAAEARLLDAEHRLTDAAQHNILHARIAVARAYLAQSRGDVAATVQHATRARTFDVGDNHLLRAQAEVLLGFAHWAGGELEAVYKVLADWVAYARQSGNLAFAFASGFYLGEIRIAQGQLREAARLYRQFLQPHQADDAALRQAAPHLHLGLALVAHEQGDAPTAAHHMQQSKALGEQAALIDWPFRWHLAQARIHESAGAWDAALNLLDAAEQRYARNPVPDLYPITALKARVQIKQGNLTAARNWAAAHNLSARDELSYLRECEHITLARLLLARYRHERTDGHLHAAHALLTRLLAAAEAGDRIASTIEILLLQALAHEAGGDLQAALTALERALALAQPEGYVRIFVDEGLPLTRLLEAQRAKRKAQNDPLQPYCNLLLSALHQPADAQAGGMDGMLRSIAQPLERFQEPLSERERQVLSLIAAGLSNQELAARLYLSLHTVKVHTRNIYGKLGVTSRTQAVARGRALGILDLPE
jgi:LuxR family maltose regulon positive regulatory protein